MTLDIITYFRLGIWVDGDSARENGMDTNSAPPISKEIRFAVVMYGGVSLAIYINGVAQELFKMVRATARKEDGSYLIPSPEAAQPQSDPKNVLSGTEVIYREIGERLHAKFVVDILSGTSAGGINAVYLAKALVNDQSLNELKNVWVQEGDIALLVNDSQSTTGLPKNLAKVLNQKPRSSLLNSHRMYFKLLDALDKMEATPPSPVAPYMDRLDLFVTATDLLGLSAALRISQQNIYELRYRSVFHFEYSTEEGYDPDKADGSQIRNDFGRSFNPFLAFAARCTSSFPFAFEPMALTDIQDILSSSAFYNVYKYEPEKWKRLFQDYLRGSGGSISVEKEADITEAVHRFEERPFGDGGYLDNKPFSYTTRAIMERQSTIPVDRKLIYIEPSPEHPEQDGLRKERPDAFSNVLSALLTLPRYETIREDLQLLMDHNRVVRRLKGTTELAMKAIFKNKKAIEFWHHSSGRNRAWERKGLQDMIKQYGEVYAVYHQLRVTQVTDDLAALITRTLGSEQESELWRKSRSILKTWRENTFLPDPVDGKEPENEFLHKLDVGWRIRRLRFLLYLLDQMFDTPDAQKEISKIDAASIFKYCDVVKPSDMQTDEYRAALRTVKRNINQVLVDLKTRVQNSPVNEFVQVIQAEGDPIEPMLHVVGHIQDALRKARVATEQALGRNQQDSAAKEGGPLSTIQACLRYYFDMFEYFDLMTFPIQYGTPLGEVDEVEIWRISPEDATSLVDEIGEKRKKLLGTRFGNFGGFFNREWRVRDILWGRLDGAERIITALVSGTDCEENAAALIERANVEILKEELLHESNIASEPLAEVISRIAATFDKSKAAWAEAVSPSAIATDPGQTFDNIVLKMGPETIRTILRKNVKDQELLQIFRQSQSAEPLKPEETLAVAARATQVMARLLDNLQTGSSLLKNRTVWIYRLGQLVSSLVQIALPGSFLSVLFRNFIGVIYLAAIIILVLGRLTNPDLTNFGWMLLGITAVFHLIIKTLTGYLRGMQTHRFVKAVLTYILIFVVGLLVWIGLSHFNQDILTPLMDFIARL